MFALVLRGSGRYNRRKKPLSGGGKRGMDMKVELITPIAIEKGLRFAIREGGRTVGSGVVGKIIE